VRTGGGGKQGGGKAQRNPKWKVLLKGKEKKREEVYSGRRNQGILRKQKDPIFPKKKGPGEDRTLHMESRKRTRESSMFD